MEKVDPLERLTDLTLLLLHTGKAVTLREIYQSVPGYPEGHGNLRQAFERDKRTLREEGIPVLAERVDEDGQFGYRIRPEDYFLADLNLSKDEQVAINLALIGVQFSHLSALDAMMKLGVGERPAGSPFAVQRSLPALGVLFDAIRKQASARFAYKGADRQVTPVGVILRWGRWYLFAWDARSEGLRTFRLDRIDGAVAVGRPRSGKLPESGVPVGDAMLSALPDGPWELGADKPVLTTVLLDEIEAPGVTAQLGEEAVVERRAGGSVVVRLEVTNRAAFRSWLLGMLGHAEVLTPAEVRESVVSWLFSITSAGKRADVSTHRGRDRAVSASDISDSGSLDEPEVTVTDSPHAGSMRMSTGKRLQRLLALLAWLFRVGEAEISEIVERFAMTESQVVAELELAACCGLPPYTPDQLMELVVLDDRVIANPGSRFTRDLEHPRRLSPSEGLAVAAAARMMLQVPGADEDGSLACALEKLERALGERHRVAVSLDVPANLEVVRQAVLDRVRLDIQYYSASSDQVTERLIDPLAVFTNAGHWYLDAYCHLAGGLRCFRVDRLLSAIPTAESFDPQALCGSAAHAGDSPIASSGVLGKLLCDGVADDRAFVPTPETRVVTVSLSGDQRWVVDMYPVYAVREVAGGRLEVDMPVGGEAWLARLLLCLGTSATVLAPAELADAGVRFAKRILARYNVPVGPASA